MTCSDCKLKNVCLERSRDYCCQSFKKKEVKRCDAKHVRTENGAQTRP